MTSKKSSSSKVSRVNLDPHKSILPQTAEWLRDKYALKARWDLSRLVVGLPTSRACRRLLELLVEFASKKKVELVPPTITTIGKVPEFLYKLQLPVASDLMQRLAWSSSLATLDDSDVKLIGPRSVDKLSWADRFAIAGLVQDLHRELAGSMLSFRDVLEIASEHEQFRDHDRWEILHRLQMAYFARMRESGVWDIQTARRFAVDKKECETDRTIVLVGSVDMNPTIRKMIEQVAENVTHLVPADDSTCQGFDDLGCLKPEFWSAFSLHVDDRVLRVGDRPADQSQILVDFLGSLNGKYSASDISIAIPDSQVTPFATRALRSAGIQSHDSTGETINVASPVRLLRKMAKFVASERFVDLANLVRHEVVFDRMTERLGDASWLNELDRLNNRRCPFKIEIAKQESPSKIGRMFNELAALVGESSQYRMQRKLSKWAVAWRKLLQRMFDGMELDRQAADSKPFASSLRYLNQVLADTESLSEHFDLKCSAADSLLAILTVLSERQLFADRDPQSIELMGWLDLTWDDAKVAAVLSFNEGTIPSSRNYHPFLPNSLRTRLGLLDNRMRYARDKFALSMLLKNREHLQLIAGRRDAFEDPLLPSRLIFNGDAEHDARRLLRLIHHSESQVGSQLTSQTPGEQRFQIPQMPPLDQVLELSVTDFDRFLACPYRFYLSRILRLRAIEDRIEEMGPATFGTLAHETLEAFGKSELKDSSNAKQIRDFLRTELQRQYDRVFAKNTLPAIEIQKTQLEMRLDRFAEIQATHRRKGWTIIQTEIPGMQRELVVDGTPVRVTGRIDRLDVHDSGRQAVIDYKTSRRHSTKSQIGKDGWKSLQLPLYHWLVRGSEYDSGGEMEVGFGRLCQSIDEIEIDIKAWQESELAVAMEQASDVVRAIRSNQFVPNPKPPYSDEFDGICQNRVFEKFRTEKLAMHTNGKGTT